MQLLLRAINIDGWKERRRTHTCTYTQILRLHIHTAFARTSARTPTHQPTHPPTHPRTHTHCRYRWVEGTEENAHTHIHINTYTYTQHTHAHLHEHPPTHPPTHTHIIPRDSSLGNLCPGDRDKNIRRAVVSVEATPRASLRANFCGEQTIPPFQEVKGTSVTLSEVGSS